MARKRHMWIAVRDTGYAVIVSGKTVRDPQKSRRYRDALLFVSAWLGHDAAWFDEEERRVCASPRAISTFRYEIPESVPTPTRD